MSTDFDSQFGAYIGKIGPNGKYLLGAEFEVYAENNNVPVAVEVKQFVSSGSGFDIYGAPGTEFKTDYSRTYDSYFSTDKRDGVFDADGN